MSNEFSPEQFKAGLVEEFDRSKRKAEAIIEGMTKSQLKRMLKTFVGVFGNSVKLKENELQDLEDLKKAMENFMSIMQAEGEIPSSFEEELN